MYLATCNRVEFLLSVNEEISNRSLERFFGTVYPGWNDADINNAISSALVLKEEDALQHFFAVASSIDSLVVGEREIITQVRNAYEFSNECGLTGDLLRLVVQKAVETAKQVYTKTGIARKPVSVVSLANRRLKELKVRLDSRFIVIGSGVTNTAMCRYLKKHGFTNFTIFNRTLENSISLAAELNARTLALTKLPDFKEGFDVLVSCTGANEPIITKRIYTALVGDDHSKKIIIDLAVPNDVSEEVLNSYDVNLIAVNNLQEIANENLKEREKELGSCERIIENAIEDFRLTLKERKVELAMSEVPKLVKEIRETALNEVFAKDLSGLDENSKEVLEKILIYMEKKYISVPMKMAREILIEEEPSK